MLFTLEWRSWRTSSTNETRLSFSLSLPSLSRSASLARSHALALFLSSLSLCPCPLRRRKGWQGASLLRQEESEHTVSQLSLAILHYVLYAVFWHKRVYYKAIHSNIVRAKRDGGQRIWLNPGEARGRSGGRSCRAGGPVREQLGD